MSGCAIETCSREMVAPFYPYPMCAEHTAWLTALWNPEASEEERERLLAVAAAPQYAAERATLNTELSRATTMRVTLGRYGVARIGTLAFEELAARYEALLQRYALTVETLDADVIYPAFMAHDIARFVDLVENYCYDGAQLLRRAEDLRHAL